MSAQHNNVAANTTNIAQSEAVKVDAHNTNRVTTDGSVVSSSDPTTKPSVSRTEKIKGDFSGAVNGTVGSLEAATGAMFGNKNLEQKGLDKMQTEDERLGAKAGVMPVGSERRETKESMA